MDTRSQVSKLCPLFLCFVVAATLQTIQPNHEHVLFADINFVMKWRIDGDAILIEISAQTTGYIAIGFSSDGRKLGSDSVICWVDHSGQAMLTDYHAVSSVVPDVDDSQDYELLYGYEESGSTTVAFRRLLNTSDANDYVINEGIEEFVLWAYNDMDPAPTPAYHPRRFALQLLLNDGQEPELPSDTQSVPLLRNKCASNCPPTWYPLPNGRCMKIVTFGYNVTADDEDICADYTVDTDVARLFIPRSDDDLQLALTVFPWVTAYAIGWNYLGCDLSDSEGNSVDLTNYPSLTNGISGTDECIYIDNNEVINTCTNSIGYICEVKSCGCH